MGQPDWWGGKADRRRQNRRSGALERSVARVTGGKVQPGSGSSWRARGDVKTSTHLIEHKYTDKESFRVKERYWNTHCEIAANCGKIPALIIHFPSTAVIITEYDE